MTPPSSLIACRIADIRARHAAGESYRKIADTFPPCVTYGTISRIIRFGHVPASPEIRKALGMVGERKERSREEEIVIAMSMMAKQGLRWKRRKK